MSEYTYLTIPKKLYEADTIPLVHGIYEWEVVGGVFYDDTIQEYIIKLNGAKESIKADRIGKDFFLTYEEAEVALKKSK